MRALTRYIILLLLLAAVVAGCNTSGCLNNQNAIPLAGFYDMATEQAMSLNILDISGVGAPDGSKILEAGTAAKQVYLPMRSAFSTTRWCIRYHQEGLDTDELNDTISFHYSSEPYFASEECGAMYFYNITRCTYTTHLIDSVAVTDSHITNVDRERIKIFLRTASDEDNGNSEDEG